MRFSTFAALRHRNYRLFFAGQLISLIGSWMQTTAQSWLVTLLAGQVGGEKTANSYLGLVITLGALPMLFGALYGGVVADRVSRRKIILLTQAAQGLLALCMAATIVTGTARLWTVLVFAVLVGITNVFDIPARQSFVVEMVGREDLPNAIGLNASLFNAARAFGPAIATELIGALSHRYGEIRATGLCFLLNGLSYIAVIAGLCLMRGDFAAKKSVRESPFSAMREAFSYLRHNRQLFLIVILLGSFTLFLTADWTLFPSLAKYTLKTDIQGYGRLMSLRGIGALVGALLVASFSSSEHKGKILTAASILYPALSLSVALCHSFTIAAFLIPLAGCSMILFLANANSMMQTSVPDALRGRIMGVHALLLMGLTPIGSGWAGALARVWDAPATIALGSGTALVVAISVAIAGHLTRQNRSTALAPPDRKA